MRPIAIRLFLIVACLALVVFAAIGCGGSSSTTTAASVASNSAGPPSTEPSITTTTAKPVKIAVFGYNSTPFSAAAVQSAVETAKSLGAEATVFNPESDPVLQATQVQDAIQTGQYQGFYLLPYDGMRLQPLVKQAADKGIKVVVGDHTLGSATDMLTLKPFDGAIATIGYALNDGIKGLVDEAKAAVDAKVGEKHQATVAIMPGLSNYPQNKLQAAALEEGLQATGYIKTVLMPEGKYTTPGGQKSTLDFFQTQPKVDVIVSFADQMVVGVVTALQQLNLTPGKDVYLVGWGANKDAVAGIKAGTWYASTGNYPVLEAKLGVQAIMDSLAGKSVPSTINVYAVPLHPAAIDKKYLDQNPTFIPDW